MCSSTSTSSVKILAFRKKKQTSQTISASHSDCTVIAFFITDKVN